MAPKMEQDETLKSLVKVATILDCFSTHRRTMSSAEICKRTGFPKSTAHRLMASMREVGFLDQERDRYRLGIKLFEYGNIVLANLDLHREARPFVDALRGISGHAVHLAVFDGLRAVVIHKAEQAANGVSALNLLESSPAHCTSIGKAILAFQPHDVLQNIIEAGLPRFTDSTITDPHLLANELEEVRAAGYAVDNGEHQPGLRCVGAPIRNSSGRVFASVSISGPAWQIPLDRVDELSKIVIYHANQTACRLGYEGALSPAT